MKFKLTLTICLVVFLGNFAKPENVPIEKARHIAKNLLFEKTQILQTSILFENEIIETDDNLNPLFYVFNLKHKSGFVIIAADDRVAPVLGYSLESDFNPSNILTNPAHNEWMQNYSDQISYSIENNLQSDAKIDNQWAKYDVQFSSFVLKETKNAVEPLLGLIEWDQNSGWNDSCPEDPAGPGGHAYAGCVATASSMIMKFYNYPLHGVGSESYYATGYGTLSANFAEATYEWPEMSPITPTPYAALIQYHMGIAVNMNYGPDGSSASSENAVTQLEQHFDYNTSAYFVYKQNYTTAVWENMVKTNLDDGMPLIYRGQGTGGHSFVLDGYDDDNADGLFHFNWGWSGSNNGYYNLFSLNPGSYNFTQYQGAGFDIYPNQMFEAPSNVIIEKDFNDVTISWTSPSDKSIAGYYVYRDYERISDLLPVSQTTYADNDLPNGGYIYNVIAYYETPEGYSADRLAQTSIQVIYNCNFTVLGGEDNLPIQGATVKVYVGTPVPISAITDENGTVSIGVSAFGTLDIEVIKEGFAMYEGTIDATEPENDLTVNLGIGTSRINTLGKKLFPNPTSNQITIDLSGETIKHYEIRDISGKIILQKTGNIVESKVTHNFNDYSKGIYYLKVVTETETYYDKIIVR